MTSLRETVHVDELDRKAPFSAFGIPLTAGETVQLYGKFAQLISSRRFTRSTLGAGFGASIENGALKLTSGTGVGQCKLYSKVATPYIPGLGRALKLSVFFDPNTSDANNVQEFGYGDNDNNIRLKLSGGQLAFVLRRNGSDVITTASTSWTTSCTPTDKGNLWFLEWEWMGVGDIFIRLNGTIVHKVDYLGLNSVPSFYRPDARFFIANYNTGTVSRNYALRAVAVALVSQGPAGGLTVPGFHASTASTINVSQNAFSPVLTIRFNAELLGIENAKLALLSRLAVGCNRTAFFRLVKNAVIENASAQRWVDAPSTPGTAPVAALGASNATGAAYSAGNSVVYKITACGAYWGSTQTETLPSAASNTLTVPSPVKQHTVTWNPIAYAGLYRIYRSINGGAYELLAEVPSYQTSFTDDAYAVISNSAPPVSNNARGDAFMDMLEGGTRVAGTGQEDYTVDTTSNTLDLSGTNLYLEPGESFTIEVNPTQNGAASAAIAWEGLY